MKLNEKDKINNGKTYLNLYYLNNLFLLLNYIVTIYLDL